MIDKHVGVEEVASYVTELFISNPNSNLLYHNILHTQKVVSRANEIAKYYELHDEELFVLLTASWFHDIGHLFGPASDHEVRSALKMREYMEAANTNGQVIQQIEACILSTRFPTNPQNLLEEILCDADLYHIGTTEFYITDLLVKREYELRNNLIAKNWFENSILLLKQHRFYTQYCRDLLEKGKLQNIRSLQEKIDRRN